MVNFAANSQIKSLFLIVFMACTFNSRAQDSGLETNYDSLIIASQNYCFYGCSESKATLFKMPVN